MVQDQIKTIIESHVTQDGLFETGIAGVRLFRATQAVPCAPVVYEPCVIAIVSGFKEAVIDGTRYVYDNKQYMCCSMSMPVQAGTPAASPQNPLYGVYIALNQSMMSDLVIKLSKRGGFHNPKTPSKGIGLAPWSDAFSDALLQVLALCGKDAEIAILAEGRLRELYYAILTGEAGSFARQSFDMGNAIARSIAHVATHFQDPLSVDELAHHAGMSRAAFHRKFKQATTLSPIQYIKTMRLNSAAAKIAEGESIATAAQDVGYLSPSQFSREFRRLYGHTPKQWKNINKQQLNAEVK